MRCFAISISLQNLYLKDKMSIFVTVIYLIRKARETLFSNAAPQQYSLENESDV